MELLKSINSLKYKNQIILLPNIYAIYFNYTPPRREVVIFEMGSPNPREFSNRNRGKKGIAFSIDIAAGRLDLLNDGDSFRVICQGNELFIVERITFIHDDKTKRCQTIMAENIYKEEVL